MTTVVVVKKAGVVAIAADTLVTFGDTRLGHRFEPNSKLFKLNTRDIVESRPDPKSIMPDGLIDQLTDQELRGLLAYLCSRR